MVRRLFKKIVERIAPKRDKEQSQSSQESSQEPNNDSSLNFSEQGKPEQSPESSGEFEISEKREHTEVLTDEQGEGDADLPKRRLIVIGDLHGDYFRLVRILTENDLVEYESASNPMEFRWRRDSEPTDLVLIGDYVDWRGEQLEGPREEWIWGSYRILLLLSKLKGDLKADPELRANYRLFLLKGNHEDMMEKALRVYKGLQERLGEAFFELLETATANFYQAMFKGISMGLSQEEVSQFMEFLNWYIQGGKQTCDSFGGINRWLEEMTTSPLASILEEMLLLVKINGYLMSHTLPDDLQLLEKVLIEGVNSLTEEEKEKFKVQVLWSRGIWGIDAFSNRNIQPPSEERILSLMEKLSLKRLIIGHTPLKYLEAGSKVPIIAYGGNLINTDLHGIPESQPFIEYYTPEGEVITIEDKALR